MPPTLRSFKLRLADEHVRVVPKTDALGCPFAGPGVDLRGTAAIEAFHAAAPLLDALRAFEPGVVIRFIAVDLERPRVTATLDPITPDADPRARVVRIDAGAALARILAASGPVIAALAMAAERALAARELPPSAEAGASDRPLSREGPLVTHPIQKPTLFAARLGDRSLFPELEPRAYLNHAGISPPSLAVKQAMARLVDSYARVGSAAFPTWMAQRQRLKGKLGQLINVAPEDLALVQSTTWGIVDVALCFPWKQGDRVIVFEGEFPANVTPWQRAAALFGLEVVFLRAADFAEDTERALAQLGRELDRGARLVAVSSVEFQTGFRMPTRAITAAAHARGAEVLVDAVQACGAVPIDATAEGIDYLACGGHKWLMCVEGTGFLYVHPERAKQLRPAVAGWLSHEHAIDFLLEGPGHLRYDRPIRSSIDFLEIGNVNAAGFAGMEAALDLIQQIGVEAVFAHINGYLDPLEAGLLERGFSSARAKDPSGRSCTLSVRPQNQGLSVVDLQRELATRGVVSAIPDGWLRFSPHWPNHPREVPLVLAALDEALAALATLG